MIKSIWEKSKEKLNIWLNYGWTALVVIAVSAVVLYFFGFRITYSPDLKWDWDAASAFADWVGVAASLWAVWAAIQIPKKIAERQDKIALFEKRLVFYEVLSNFLQYGHNVDRVKTLRDAHIHSIVSFSKELPEEISEDWIQRESIRLRGRALTVLNEGKFLFGFEIEKWTLPLMVYLQLTQDDQLSEKERKEVFDLYKEAASNAEQFLLPLIEKELTLYGRVKEV